VRYGVTGDCPEGTAGIHVASDILFQVGPSHFLKDLWSFFWFILFSPVFMLYFDIWYGILCPLEHADAVPWNNLWLLGKKVRFFNVKYGSLKIFPEVQSVVILKKILSTGSVAVPEPKFFGLAPAPGM
jgi:hypothetical protein